MAVSAGWSRCAGLSTVAVCRDSGRKPRPRCPVVEEILRPGQEPSEQCDIHLPRQDNFEGLWRRLEDMFD